MKALIVWDGENLTVPAEMGTPRSDQLASTSLDNLVELAGRVCYDSLNSPKSRDSEGYHRHIDEVKHFSTREHAVFTFESVNSYPDHDILTFCTGLLGRRGLTVKTARVPDKIHEHRMRITANLRAIQEWFDWDPEISISGVHTAASYIGLNLRHQVRKHCPLAMSGLTSVDLDEIGFRIVPPRDDNEVHLSWYIDGISRGNSHELVRHRGPGISQRSTRYVDESESPWIWHPLNRLAPDLADLNEQVRQLACAAYDRSVARLQQTLIDRGVDKGTARKQARGAARGLLGNALETKMIWTCSIEELKWILSLRAADPADAEIRDLAVLFFQEASQRFPDRFQGYSLAPSSDGLGQCVVFPGS